MSEQKAHKGGASEHQGHIQYKYRFFKSCTLIIYNKNYATRNIERIGREKRLLIRQFMAVRDRYCVNLLHGDVIMVSTDGSLKHYLAEIGKEKNLSSSEEAVLSSEIRNGNQQALADMVLANLRFVVSVAKNYTHQGLPFSDLVSEGNLGLIRAARMFD
ncbi:MAG: hypothetical protein GF350_06750, partial [Chitinivibrionales bacterium]|nr:hypothetical protein [Chitinivibrionales bacterium]